MHNGDMQFRASAVSFSYILNDGHINRVLDGIDFEIQEQELLCLMGPSGCGKTTLLNLIAGFLKPDCGQMCIDGKQILSPGRDRAVVFQDYGLFPWKTVEDNVTFG